MALATAFGRVYLTVSNYSKTYDRLLRGAEAASWIIVIWAMISPSIPLVVAAVTTLLVAGSLVIVSALYVLSRGLDIAKFYLIAWAVIIVGGVLHVSGNFGFMTFSAFTEHLLQMSNMAEAMLLSFGLGYIINILNKPSERVNSYFFCIIGHLRRTTK